MSATIERPEAAMNVVFSDPYVVHNGIPNFNRLPPCENAKVRDELEHLNLLARDRGWLEALKTVYESAPDLVRYVIDSDRARFLDLLPITASSQVLEIGPGLGQFTPLLARRAESVCALEVVEQQAEFVAERCRQEQVTNVSVACGGDDCRLPYPDGSFDLVVLNLVFEWCGSRASTESPETLQRRLLAEIYRVLKPGGIVYLTTKNRYSLRYIVGGRDEHMGQMRFGSALPRRLAGWYMALRGKNAAGLLHSWSELRAWLQNAGLSVDRSYWLAPEMRYPKNYVEANAAAIRTARQGADFPQGETRLIAALMRLLPAGLVRYFTPGLAFLAHRPE